MGDDDSPDGKKNIQKRQRQMHSSGIHFRLLEECKGGDSGYQKVSWGSSCRDLQITLNNLAVKF